MRIYILSVLIGLLTFSTSALSQSIKDRKLENYILAAIEKYNESDLDSAKEMLAAVLLEDSTYDAAWYYQALIAVKENKSDLAQECLKRASELDPMNFWYRYRLAMLYAYTGSEEVAVDMYEKLLEDFPKKNELYFEMVDLYVGQGNYDKALETISEIENEFGQSEALVLTEYRILHLLGRPEDAMQALREYNNRYSSPYVLCILAEDEMQQYNDSIAVAYYDEALDLDSSFSPALLGKAEVYRTTHMYDEYFPVLNDYIQISDATAEEKAKYLLALIEQGDPKFMKVFRPEMDLVIQKFVEVHFDKEKVYEVGGMYYFYTNRLDQARSYFEAYVEAHPESYEASAALVEFLMYIQDWEALSEEGRKAYQRFPEEPAYLEMASVGDYRLGNYEAVLNACHELLKVASDDEKKVNTLSTMGDVYHFLGDSKKAYKIYESALKIDPDNVYVLNNYAYYLSMEGKNLKKAYEMSKKTIEVEPDNATYLDTFGWILYLQGKYIEARPVFKNAMLHGGKDSAVILDHYAEVLFALKEYDMAFVYWNLALQKNDDEGFDLKAKVEAKRAEVKK